MLKNHEVKSELLQLLLSWFRLSYRNWCATSIQNQIKSVKEIFTRIEFQRHVNFSHDSKLISRVVQYKNRFSCENKNNFKDASRLYSEDVFKLK